MCGTPKHRLEDVEAVEEIWGMDDPTGRVINPYRGANSSWHRNGHWVKPASGIVRRSK